MPENNNLYRQLFENSIEVQFLLVNRIFVQCNQAALNIFGYSSRSDILGKHPAELSPPTQPDGSSSRTKADKEISKALKAGSNRFEWVCKKRNGKTFPVEVLLTRLEDDEGNTIIHTSMHDISKQEEISNELSESENRFKQLSNLSFEGIIIHEFGTAIDVNLAIEKISGYTREEIIGNSILDIFVPEEYKPLVMDEIIKNKTSPYHIEARHKAGHLVPIEIESRNITINNKKVRVTAIRDLSERKMHQSELEKSREQYKSAYDLFRLMLDTTPDMIWAKDMEGNFTFTNKAICEKLINAKDVEEPIGKHVMYFVNREREAHPENKEWFTFGEECGDSDAITIKNRKASRFIEYGNVFGKNLILDVVKTPLWNEKGEMIGTVGSARDITKQKEADKELKLSEQRYRMLFENSPDPIIIHDGKVILDVNTATLLKSGLKSKTELIGNDVLALVHPEDRPKAINRMKKMLKDSTALETEEFRILSYSGEELTVIASPAPITFKGKSAFMVTYHDITSRKKAEQAIAEKENQFHTVVEAAPDAILLMDYYSTRIILANRQASLQTGYTDQELLTLTIMDIHPPFKDDEYRNHVRGRIIEEKTVSLEMDITHKDGNTFPAEVTVTFLYYNGGKVLLAFVKDITERKMAEKDIRDSQERFKTLSDITFEGILIHNKGVAIDLNLSLANMFGYTKEELVGKNMIKMLTAKESIPLIKANLNKKHAESYRVIGIKKDGTRFPVELEAKSVTLNNNQSIRVAAFRDISERVKTEEAFKSSEEKFKNAFVTSPDSISISSWKTGRYVAVNQSFVDTMGYTEEEAIGRTSLELNIWKDPSKRSRFVKRLQSKKMITNLEAEFVTKSGKTIYALLSASTIEFAGEPCILSIGRDITDRVASEEKLKVLYEELRQQNITLEKLNEELKAAKQKAEEADRLKSAFLANMSHEIRTPMNGILGFSGLLKNINITTQERLTYINVIEQSGNRLLNIINDLIDISKIEAGQMTVNRVECNITNQLKNIYTFFKRESQQKNIELILHHQVKKDLLTLITDEDKFVAILTNLIKNALKYTKEGSIVVGYRRDNGFVEFFVKDTGIGISADRHEAIFERFVQADIEDREVYEGAGLGLAITKAYVTMLGGDIWLESEKGKGSTFYFTLPDNSPNTILKPVKEQKRDMDKETKISKLNILIVEDEVFSDQLLTVVLKKIANNIYHAKSGLHAIDAFKKHPDIDLIMMDIKMREMDGYQATKEIRKLDKNVIIIAQTAYALLGDREKALEAGCNDYLPKPIIKKKVLETISKYFII